MRKNLNNEATHRGTGRRPLEAEVWQGGHRARPHCIRIQRCPLEDLRRSYFNDSLAAASAVRAAQAEELATDGEVEADRVERGATPALRRPKALWHALPEAT